jgi:hypothetical protein
MERAVNATITSGASAALPKYPGFPQRIGTVKR